MIGVRLLVIEINLVDLVINDNTRRRFEHAQRHPRGRESFFFDVVHPVHVLVDSYATYVFRA